MWSFNPIAALASAKSAGLRCYSTQNYESANHTHPWGVRTLVESIIRCWKSTICLIFKTTIVMMLETTVLSIAQKSFANYGTFTKRVKVCHHWWSFAIAKFQPGFMHQLCITGKRVKKLVKNDKPVDGLQQNCHQVKSFVPDIFPKNAEKYLESSPKWMISIGWNWIEPIQRQNQTFWCRQLKVCVCTQF